MKSVHIVGINDADYVTQVMQTTGYVDGKRKRVLAWGVPFLPSMEGYA